MQPFFPKYSSFQQHVYRQARGAIIKALSTHPTMTETKLCTSIPGAPATVTQALESLLQEKFIIKVKAGLRLA